MTGFDRLKAQLVDAVKSRVEGDRHPALPEAGVMLWNIFGSLAAQRSYHAAGPNPISFAEMLAWSNVFRTPLEPHHVEILVAMDQAWIEAVNARNHRAAGGEASAPRGHKLTADVFDQLF